MRNFATPKPAADAELALPAATSARYLPVIATAALLITALISLNALADSGHNHGSVSQSGRFTPNSDGTPFPPQPRGATNVRSFSSAQSRAGNVGGQRAVANNASAAVAMATTAALNDAEVQNALGERFAHVATVAVRDKWNKGVAGYRVTFFSHSNNQTVAVTHDDAQLRDLTLTPAAQSQPPLASSEMSEAIAIARNYWVGRSNPRISSLTGYAIQTYRDDGSAHLTRIVYVSFHTESPAAPELLTWVDLNSQQVTRAQEVQ